MTTSAHRPITLTPAEIVETHSALQRLDALVAEVFPLQPFAQANLHFKWSDPTPWEVWASAKDNSAGYVPRPLRIDIVGSGASPLEAIASAEAKVRAWRRPTQAEAAQTLHECAERIGAKVVVVPTPDPERPS